MSLQRDNWVIGSGAWCADICYIKQWFSLSPQGCINLGHPISPRIPTACRLHPNTSSLPHLTPYGRGQNWSSEGREHALPPRGNTFSSIHARFLERKRAAESTKKLRNRQNYQFLMNERETIQNHIQTTLLLLLLLCKVLHLGLVAQVQGFSSVGLSPTSHANLRLRCTRSPQTCSGESWAAKATQPCPFFLISLLWSTVLLCIYFATK